jgi:hypothetical protein
MPNLLKGFRKFVEEKEQPDKYVSVVKKQLKVPKSLWLGMPVLVSNTKIGDKTIIDPTMFYVSDFDRDSVTIVNVPDPGDYEGEEGDIDSDPDDEINLDKKGIHGHVEFVLSRDDFYQLQTPQIPPGGDAMGGGMGMGGL